MNIDIWNTGEIDVEIRLNFMKLIVLNNRFQSRYFFFSRRLKDNMEMVFSDGRFAVANSKLTSFHVFGVAETSKRCRFED